MNFIKIYKSAMFAANKGLTPTLSLLLALCMLLNTSCCLFETNEECSEFLTAQSGRLKLFDSNSKYVCQNDRVGYFHKKAKFLVFKDDKYMLLYAFKNDQAHVLADYKKSGMDFKVVKVGEWHDETVYLLKYDDFKAYSENMENLQISEKIDASDKILDQLKHMHSKNLYITKDCDSSLYKSESEYRFAVPSPYCITPGDKNGTKEWLRTHFDVCFLVSWENWKVTNDKIWTYVKLVQELTESLQVNDEYFDIIKDLFAQRYVLTEAAKKNQNDKIDEIIGVIQNKYKDLKIATINAATEPTIGAKELHSGSKARKSQTSSFNILV